METNMPSEKIGALIWRFIGVLVLVAALPGFALSLRPLIWIIVNLGTGIHSFAAFLPLFLFLFLVQVIVGLLILRFSRSLGKAIARGL